MSYSKHKDAKPATSIAKARAALSSLGINMQGELVRPVDGARSIHLKDNLHNWSVNGKGSTDEYCLASGYGEAMERLQTHYAYDRTGLSSEAQAYLGFERALDESVRPISDIAAAAPDVYTDMQTASRMDADELSDDRLMHIWQGVLSKDTVAFLPYYSVKRDELVPLPDLVLSNLSGSNGLAAGNTPEEALCQCISEILERHVKYRILRERLTPPEVPRTYLYEHHRELYDVMEQIEALGNFCIYVMDASMGCDYPVMCLALIDRSKARYHIKFGAHPVFDIALERCLTELLQGYTPGDEEADGRILTPWVASPAPFDSVKNQYALFRDDVAAVPDSFFAGTPSWTFKPWPQADFNNATGTRRLVDMLVTISGDVYIRDFGFLGFPAYRIYAPGVSTDFYPRNEQELEFTRIYHELLTVPRRAASLTPQEMRRFIDFLSSTDTALNDIETVGGVSTVLLQAALMHDSGDIEGMIKVLRGISCDNNRYRCAAREQELARDGVPLETRDALLKMFYGEKALKYTDAFWRGSSVLPKLFALRNNIFTEASDGALDKSARADAIDALHMRLKDAMVQGKRNQLALRDIVRPESTGVKEQA